MPRRSLGAAASRRPEGSGSLFVSALLRNAEIPDSSYSPYLRIESTFGAVFGPFAVDIIEETDLAAVAFDQRPASMCAAISKANRYARRVAIGRMPTA